HWQNRVCKGLAMVYISLRPLRLGEKYTTQQTAARKDSRKGAKSAKIMIPQIMSASRQDKHGGSCDAQR
ncbi:MAG: hypothetical protein SPK35_04635, partial [Prevotella sp.]|nr:hypothetical protein [Prevotella sp.]